MSQLVVGFTPRWGNWKVAVVAKARRAPSAVPRSVAIVPGAVGGGLPGCRASDAYGAARPDASSPPHGLRRPPHAIPLPEFLIHPPQRHCANLRGHLKELERMLVQPEEIPSRQARGVETDGRGPIPRA